MLIPWLLTTSILFVIVRTCVNQSKCNYKKYSRYFLNIFLNFCNLYQILNFLQKKKMTLLAYVFSKFLTVKDSVAQMFKWQCVMASFYRQHVKRWKKLVKCQWQNFYDVSLSRWAKLAWKTSLSFWYVNSYKSLFKHCLPITSILFVIFFICRRYINCNYLKN